MKNGKWNGAKKKARHTKKKSRRKRKSNHTFSECHKQRRRRRQRLMRARGKARERNLLREKRCNLLFLFSPHLPHSYSLRCTGHCILQHAIDLDWAALVALHLSFSFIRTLPVFHFPIISKTSLFCFSSPYSFFCLHFSPFILLSSFYLTLSPFPSVFNFIYIDSFPSHFPTLFFPYFSHINSLFSSLFLYTSLSLRSSTLHT